MLLVVESGELTVASSADQTSLLTLVIIGTNQNRDKLLHMVLTRQAVTIEPPSVPGSFILESAQGGDGVRTGKSRGQKKSRREPALSDVAGNRVHLISG